jgi:hypothetical protein
MTFRERILALTDLLSWFTSILIASSFPGMVGYFFTSMFMLISVDLGFFRFDSIKLAACVLPWFREEWF